LLLLGSTRHGVVSVKHAGLKGGFVTDES
jgi:hypothetical protein